MAATKAQLLELIDCQQETIAIQAKTIVHQKEEITNAVEQITQICEGMTSIAENNSQTRAMVEDVSDRLEGKLTESPGWWN